MSFSDAGIRQAIDGHEVGGGNGWRPDLHPADAGVEVSTYAGLKSALAGSKEVIAIADDAAIVVDEHLGLNLRDKRLVSYRGWDGRTGGLLYTSKQGYHSGRPFTPLYSDGTTSPEVHGLRIYGADRNRSTFRPARDSSGNHVYNRTLARAIMLRGTGGRISNCEISGWTWNGVHVKGRSPRVTHAEVDHCVMDKSLQIGYGYNVDVWRGFADIHHNYFNEARGAIDGFGWADSGYDVHHNLFGPTTYRHSVDMHCLVENKQHTTMTNTRSPTWALRAGGRLQIRNNQFCFSRNNRGGPADAIGIRGVPMHSCSITDNWFHHARRPSSNPGKTGTGVAWSQGNVLSKSYGNITLNSRGYSPNLTDSGNEFGVTTLQLEQLGAFGSTATSSAGHRARNLAYARRLGDLGASLQGVRDALALS